MPCSPKHKHCSPAHANLVRSYREERERQQLAFDEEYGVYEGDVKRAKENGVTLITFKQYLTGQKGERDSWESVSSSVISFGTTAERLASRFVPILASVAGREPPDRVASG